MQRGRFKPFPTSTHQFAGRLFVSRTETFRERLQTSLSPQPGPFLKVAKFGERASKFTRDYFHSPAQLCTARQPWGRTASPSRLHCGSAQSSAPQKTAQPERGVLEIALRGLRLRAAAAQAGAGADARDSGGLSTSGRPHEDEREVTTSSPWL